MQRINSNNNNSNKQISIAPYASYRGANVKLILMLSWSWSLWSNSGGYLRDYRPQWTPFFSPFHVVT